MGAQFIDLNALKTFKTKQDNFNSGKFMGISDYVDTGTLKIKSSVLPSYVDDVRGIFGADVEVEGETVRKFYLDVEKTQELTAAAAEKDVIYVDVNNNKTYRTTGSVFVVISDEVSTAEKTLKDINGNQIDLTYATKAELTSETTKVATATTVGVVKIGANISVDEAGLISVNGGSTSETGVLKVGANINVDSDSTISVPIASVSNLGLVKIGEGLTFDSETGIISITVADVNDIFGSDVVTETDAASDDDIDSLFD